MDDARIQSVIDRVMSELRHADRVGHGPRSSPPDVSDPPAPAHEPKHGDNLFPDVESAVTARPLRDLSAPVNAPFTEPKSSASRRLVGIAATLTATNGPARPEIL